MTLNVLHYLLFLLSAVANANDEEESRLLWMVSLVLHQQQ